MFILFFILLCQSKEITASCDDTKNNWDAVQQQLIGVQEKLKEAVDSKKYDSAAVLQSQESQLQAQYNSVYAAYRSCSNMTSSFITPATKMEKIRLNSWSQYFEKVFTPELEIAVVKTAKVIEREMMKAAKKGLSVASFLYEPNIASPNDILAIKAIMKSKVAKTKLYWLFLQAGYSVSINQCAVYNQRERNREMEKFQVLIQMLPRSPSVVSFEKYYIEDNRQDQQQGLPESDEISASRSRSQCPESM